MKKKLITLISTSSLIFASSTITLLSCSNNQNLENKFNVSLEETLNIGDESKIIVSGATSNDKISYTSSNENIISVDSLGIIKAINTGEATIIVTINNTIKKELKVKIIDNVNKLDLMLDKLKSGYKAKNVYLEKQDFGFNSSGNHDITYVSKYTESYRNENYNFIKRSSSTYLDEEIMPELNSDPIENENIYESFIFSKDPNINNDIATTCYLDISNEIIYSPAKNGVGVNYKWYETFSNFFTLLSSNHFKVSEDNPNDFILDTSNNALLTIYESIADNIYGSFIDTRIDNFILHTDGNKIIGYEGSFLPLKSTALTLTTTITFKGLITNIGSDSFLDLTPITGNEDKVLEDKLKDLQNNNFEVYTQVQELSSWGNNYYYVKGKSDGGNNVTQINYLKNDALLSTITSEHLFMCYEDFGSKYTQKLTKLNNEYYHSMSRVKSSLNEGMLPSFNISSKFFIKGDDNTYTFRNDLPYYFIMPTTSIFSIFYSNYFNNFSIKINKDDSITFNTSYNTSYSTTNEITTYSKINEVDSLSVDSSKIHKTTDEFDDIKDYFYLESDYTKAINLVSKEVIDLLPLPGGNVSEVYPTIKETENLIQIKYLLDQYGDLDYQYDNLIVEGTNALASNGFKFNPISYNGYEFSKEMNINETNKLVNISFGISSPYFVIDIKLKEVSSETTK